jgi:hypothetical protein
MMSRKPYAPKPERTTPDTDSSQRTARASAEASRKQGADARALAAETIRAAAVVAAKKTAADALAVEAERVKHQHDVLDAEARRLKAEHAQAEADLAAKPWHRKLFDR